MTLDPAPDHDPAAQPADTVRGAGAAGDLLAEAATS